MNSPSRAREPTRTCRSKLDIDRCLGLVSGAGNSLVERIRDEHGGRCEPTAAKDVA
jgi:hypothetical protein